MSWFKKKPNFGFKIPRKREAPDGLWIKCEKCNEILYARELERDLRVCAKCGYHFKLGCREYVELLTDEGSFVEMDAELSSVDPLGFRDSKRYADRLKEYRKRSQLSESVLTGTATVAGHQVCIGVMDFSFMGGTLGSATGEKVARLIHHAADLGTPLIIVSTSGGARMQEGILSLMQMAKTAVALARLHELNLPYVSILLNPTTAGVAASYASLGDIILAEPGAQIGFAGPRVIQQTINQDLPDGFQTAEFVLEHGMIDRIVPRAEMAETVTRILEMFLVPRKQVADAGMSAKRDAPPPRAAAVARSPEPAAEPELPAPSENGGKVTPADAPASTAGDRGPSTTAE